MTPYTKGLKPYCVRWSHSDDVGSAPSHYFISRDESAAFATQKQEQGVPYVWMSEYGEYKNRNGTIVNDMIYWWWSPEAVKGNSGPLPSSGQGVPNSKSWRYHTPYQLAEVTKVHLTLPPDSKPSSPKVVGTGQPIRRRKAPEDGGSFERLFSLLKDHTIRDLWSRFGDEFSQSMDMLARYWQQAIQAADDDDREYSPDLGGLAYFCGRALMVINASEVLLHKMGNELKTAARTKGELKEIARRPDALPFPIGLVHALEKVNWLDNVERVTIRKRTVYRTAPPSKTKAKTGRKTFKGRGTPKRTCPVCGFATTPSHDARKHRGQGNKKRPFTSKQLKEFGFVKS
jgi:hypothetical protein